MKGRHRRGSPAVQVARREWDRDQRSQAARLDQAEAGWTVMYGVGGRRFYAIATTHVPEPQVVEARTAEELHELIRETGPPVRLSLWAMPEGVCVRVTDHGPGRPHRLDLGQDATSGRGLAIVEALADQWGVIPVRAEAGKTVWAAWRLPCGRSDAPRTADCASPLPSAVGVRASSHTLQR
ncbi:ATP-binding protein [Streptosporangium roseum]|uniref:ATP-binding protein n=1 Tax=Streptosporangium roseum TaxID=2001 RepID=UPI0012DDCC1E|nr:ATP-binding protein [Streptosporangium roseum]